MRNLWNRNLGDYTVDDIDRWSSLPPDTIWAKWCGGVMFPLLIMWPAVKAITTKVAYIPGEHSSRVDLEGINAVLFGCTLVCLALFLHSHYFWGNSKRLLPIHESGKTVSLFGFCLFALWLLFRIFKGFFK